MTLAVAINKETVFILFGIDSTVKPVLSLLMLNVSNPSKVTWLEKYADQNAPAVVLPNTNSTSVEEPLPSTKSKLSTGATAGIAVGASAVSFFYSIIIFLLL